MASERAVERVILVTGGSRGIGAAVGLALARPGVGLALVGRTSSSGASVAAACCAAGADAVSWGAELGESGAAAGLVEAALGRWGRLDVVVHSAGLWLEGGLDAVPVERWEEVLEVNVGAVVRLTHASLPWLRASGSGAVVLISSVAGRRSYAGGAVYCASKHALQGFAGALFEDAREDGVKVCTICPGVVNTSMHSPEAEGLEASKMIQPGDVAEAVRFVLEASPTVCPTEIVLMPQRNPRVRRS